MDKSNSTDRGKLMAEVRRAQNRLRNIAFLRREPEQVAVNEFPERWKEFFPGTKQMIKGVHMPKGSGCICAVYHSQYAGNFKDHVHDFADENIFVITGGISIETPTGTTKLTRGQSFTIEAGVAHGCKFDANTLFLITWLGEGDDFLGFDFLDKSTCKDRVILDLANEITTTQDEKEIERLRKEIETRETIPCSNPCHAGCVFTKPSAQ